jgi:hypothetical protein
MAGRDSPSPATAAAFLAMALAAWALAAVCMVGTTVVWRDVRRLGPAAGVDYLALYTAGELFREAPERLHDLGAQRAAQRAIVGADASATDMLPFPYPAYVAAAMAPIGRLGFARSYALVAVANLALLAANLVWVWRRAPLSGRAALWWALVTAASLPVWLTLVQGQVSIAVLFLWSLHALDFRAGARSRSGVWLGMLTFKPQIAGLALALVARRRAWRSLSVACVVAGALWASVLPLVGRAAVADHLRLLAALAAGEASLGVHPERMFNLRGFFSVVAPAPWSDVLWAASSASVVLLLLWPPPGRDPGRRGTRRHWAAAVLGALLVSPHVNAHDLALVALANGLILSAAGARTSVRAAASTLALSAVPTLAIVAGPASTWPSVVVVAMLVAAFGALLAADARARPVTAGGSAA